MVPEEVTLLFSYTQRALENSEMLDMRCAHIDLIVLGKDKTILDVRVKIILCDSSFTFFFFKQKTAYEM